MAESLEKSGFASRTSPIFFCTKKQGFLPLFFLHIVLYQLVNIPVQAQALPLGMGFYYFCFAFFYSDCKSVICLCLISLCCLILCFSIWQYITSFSYYIIFCIVFTISILHILLPLYLYKIPLDIVVSICYNNYSERGKAFTGGGIRKEVRT